MWGPGASAGFQNALTMGMQMGAQARQARDQRNERNALAAYAKDPSETNFGGLADVRPDLAIQERGRMQEQRQQEALQGLTGRALQGDPDALDELARVSFDRWKSIDTQQRQVAAREAEVNANAALDVLSYPPEQRGARIMGYAQQLGSQDIARIAQLPPDQQEAALRAAVAEGQMVERLIRMERPDYMAIPAGGTLVDTNNPAAVSQFGSQAPSNIPQEAIEALRRGDGSPEQFDEVFGAGSAARIMGGTASNGGGGFLGH